MTEIEQFLSGRKLFSCERLRASLTLEQCEANRKRTPAIFQCSDCAGLGKAIELEERMSESKCKCGGVVFAKNSGECRPCYDKRKHIERKAKRAAGVPVQTRQQKIRSLDNKPPVEQELTIGRAMSLPDPAPVNPLAKLLQAPPVLSMTLDFSNDARLYAQLIEHRIDEEQIIELLSMLVSQELRRAA